MALVLVLCALLVLSFVVLALARRIDQAVFLATGETRLLDARALAYSGVQFALHPQVTVRTPLLHRQVDRGHSYQARITGEGGKLQLNWMLAGEDPVKIQVLKQFLQYKGLKLEEVDTFVDCLLDYVSPSNLHHAKGSRTTTDGSPVPGKPFDDLAEVRRVVGSEPLTKQPGWENDFTLWSQGPIDLKWADETLLGALPGVGLDRARAFVQQRRGPDKLDGTEDDYPIDNIALAEQMLGFNQQTLAQVQNLLSINDPTVRIISVGRALDTSHTIEAVARKQGMQPQIIQWKEF
ncbi:MAG: general secretion pathway protein GspK [Gluconacetobacter diazotrophicus]|nr:general secretion pathway protein GspK [Gluconacetobacter diazotrophicus]